MRRSAPSRKRVLIDTGAFYAFADESDAHHADAIAIFSGLVGNGDSLFTTSFVVSETHALLLNRLHQPAATQFLKDTEDGTRISVMWVTPNDVKQARTLIYRYDDKRYSLTDATSFVVMERLKLSHAFTFDRNFSQYGVTILTPTTV